MSSLFLLDDDERGSDEGDEEEGGEEEEMEEEDEELDDDPSAAAGAYFAAHRGGPRRTSRLASNKKSLADLPGGGPQELSAAVHKLLSRSTSCSAAIHDRFCPQYPEWLSLLHGGFSLLLHGFGSKKELLEDFASGLDSPKTPVLVLQGFASGARLRELMLMLLTHVLHVPAAPSGTTRALCNQVKRAFATAAPPPPPPVQSHAVKHLLRLLPTAGTAAPLPISESALSGGGGGGSGGYFGDFSGSHSAEESQPASSRSRAGGAESMASASSASTSSAWPVPPVVATNRATDAAAAIDASASTAASATSTSTSGSGSGSGSTSASAYASSGGWAAGLAER